jgi:tetratricopeptide (TPR) repeat protein
MTTDIEFYSKWLQKRYTQDFTEAIADLDQAILLAPDNLEYRWERAYFRHYREEYLLALEDFAKLLELSTDIDDLERIYHSLALAHNSLELTDAWLADLDWLAEHGRMSSNEYIWRGQYKYWRGQYEAALEDFTTALQLAPGTANYLLVRSNAYAQLGRYKEEIEDLNAVLTTSEFHERFFSAIYLKRAIAFFRLGDKERAFADYDESARLSEYPNTVSAADYFAAHL